MHEFDEPLVLSCHEDITSRPQWRDDLDPAEHRLQKILGDYDFPKALEWACGLSTCRQIHQRGFLVRTEDGLETHIGNVCGVKHFHLVSWEAERSRYRKAKDDAELRQYLEQSLAERDTLAAQAQARVQALDELLPQLRAVLERLARDPDVHRVFMEALRAGGAIRKARTLSREEAESQGLPPGRRTLTETVAQLGGLGAVQLGMRPGAPARPSLPGVGLFNQLRELLNSTLPRLTQERLAETRVKDRPAIAAEIRQARETIALAATSIEEARRFLDPANLRKLSLLDLRRVSGRASKVLNHFARLTQPPEPGD